MHTIGVIAEYNPFHSGHGHHLRMLSQTFGPDCAVVCVMSGNWVQRGDAALADKWTRAELALRQGADLILELPTLWAVSSAESFARGGVALLTATGVVDTLSFGSEAGILSPSRQWQTVWRARPGAACCARHWRRASPFPWPVSGLPPPLGENAQCLRHPNNNLGIEYLRALRSLGSPWFPTPSPPGGGPRPGANRPVSCLRLLPAGKAFGRTWGNFSGPPSLPPGGSAPAGQPCQPGILHPGGFGPSAGHGGRRLFPTT